MGRLDLTECPHCHVPLTDQVHTCADKRPWTNEDRDLWHEYLRTKYPSVPVRKVDPTVSRGR